MAVPHPAGPVLRPVCSMTGLLFAVLAILLPFIALLSHRLDGLALISLPLSIIAAYMERDARGAQDSLHGADAA